MWIALILVEFLSQSLKAFQQMEDHKATENIWPKREKWGYQESGASCRCPRFLQDLSQGTPTLSLWRLWGTGLQALCPCFPAPCNGSFSPVPPPLFPSSPGSQGRASFTVMQPFASPTDGYPCAASHTPPAPAHHHSLFLHPDFTFLVQALANSSVSFYSCVYRLHLPVSGLCLLQAIQRIWPD